MDNSKCNKFCEEYDHNFICSFCNQKMCRYYGYASKEYYYCHLCWAARIMLEKINA